MVPVPEEHVEEAMQAILRISSRAKMKGWDQEAVSAVFHEVDEPSRAVISAVARGVIARGMVADLDVADSIELTQREVLGVVREVNERAQSEERLALISVRMETETLPNGRTREKRMMLMDNEIAAFVREAERLEVAEAPHPLLSDER